MALSAYAGDPNNPLSGAPNWAWNRDRLTDAVTAARNQILGPAAAAGPTWADAYEWNRQNLADTAAAMRDPQTWVDAARLYGNALLMGTTAPGIRAFHGSPYDFERFSTGQIGTGEGTPRRWHSQHPISGSEQPRQGRRDQQLRRVQRQDHRHPAQVWHRRADRRWGGGGGRRPQG